MFHLLGKIDLFRREQALERISSAVRRPNSNPSSHAPVDNSRLTVVAAHHGLD
jgi:hypothetical protein